MRIDSLRLAEAFRAADGDPNKMARAIADELGEMDTTQLATKTDLERFATKGDIAEVKGEIAQLELRITRLGYALVLGAIAVSKALDYFLP